MLLFIQREKGDDRATAGKMFIDGEYFCYTLEPKYVNPGVKINGQTAIPAGQYFLMLRHSERFSRILPQIMNVPTFSNILIHPGNRARLDSQGCILIGLQKGSDEDGTPVIWESQKATENLMAKLLDAEKNQVLAICIKDA